MGDGAPKQRTNTHTQTKNSRDFTRFPVSGQALALAQEVNQNNGTKNKRISGAPSYVYNTTIYTYCVYTVECDCTAKVYIS